MEPKLKLFEIANDEEILKDAFEMDAGLFVNEYQHAIYYFNRCVFRLYRCLFRDK